MKLRALVIDDEFEVRQESYRRLASEQASSAEMSLEVPTYPPFEPGEIETLARRCQVALVDVILKKNLLPFEIARGLDVLQILEKANPRLPIFLVSNKWSDVFLKIYDRLLRTKQIVGGTTIESLERADERAKVRFEIANAVRVAWGIAQASLGPDDELLVLHLSDSQFGGTLVSGADETAAQRIVTEVFDALPKTPDGFVVKPQILVVTGDIAQHGEPEEFAVGLRFLTLLRDKLRIPREGCFVVPGNHDVSLRLASARHLSYDFKRGFAIEDQLSACNPTLARDPTVRGLQRFGLAPFRDFCRAFTGRDDWALDTQGDGGQLERATWFSSALFSAFGLQILGLNTVSLLGPEDPARAEVPQTSITAISTHLDCLREQSPFARQTLNLVLLHHSPWSGLGDRALGSDGAFLLTQLESRGDSIVLFGHVHEHYANIQPYTGHAERQVLYVTASTVAQGARARPEDSLRGFNLLHLHRSQDLVTGARIEIFTYQGGRYRPRETKEFSLNPARGWVQREN